MRCTPTTADCAPLAELLQEQADGNPFFLTEVLKTLAQSRAIAFAPDLGRWRWSLDAVRASGITANVVDFVVAKLRTLPRPDAEGAATRRVHRQYLRSQNTVDHQRTVTRRHRQEPDAGASAAPGRADERRLQIGRHHKWDRAGRRSTSLQSIRFIASSTTAFSRQPTP